jgi:hypothetical protein
MAALTSFAEELAKGGLSNFELSNKRFTILKKGMLTFITNSDKKIKPKKVHQELLLVVDKFFNRFPEESFLDWDGDITEFSEFTIEIEESLEDPIKKMQKAFW